MTWICKCFFQKKHKYFLIFLFTDVNLINMQGDFQQFKDYFNQKKYWGLVEMRVGKKAWYPCEVCY